MNTSKHTPGPWTKGTSNEGKECVWLNGLTEPFYGMGPDHTWIDCGTEANANLVAAAPDLLEALKEAELVLAEKLRRLGADPNVSPTTHRIRAAISKATGGEA